MSSGGTNSTIEYPGPGWQLLMGDGFKNFQLDIVGFLAVLGEGSVTANAQVSALSRLFYLPRLLPAPQALLPPSRPKELEPTTGWVTGVFSGNQKDHIHHVASVLLSEFSDMSQFTVRCVEIKKTAPTRPPTRTDIIFRGLSKEPMNPASKRARMNTLLREAPTHDPPDKVFETPSVKAKATGPLSWVTLLGFALSLSLLILSLVFGDGMSLLATILLSGLSTLIGLANKWELRLPRRLSRDNSHRGDVVVRYPNGSYLVVKCSEDVARELFFAPEEINYNIEGPVTYRMVSLFGTILLMGGIIFLANARLQLQFAWAGAYIIINAAHWIAAAVPPRLHWDLSCYEVNEQGVDGGPMNETFTGALWKAILISKSHKWVRIGKTAPQTAVWDEWLELAGKKAQEFRSRTGELKEPIRPSRKGPCTSIIWESPNPKTWEAKAEWDAVNRKYPRTEGVYSASSAEKIV